MNDLIHALGIDWYALLAQAINFFILMFVLGRFVYKPVLKVLDDRKQLVADSMEKVKEIDRHKELVDKERVEILHKADVQAGELLNRAKTEAEAIRVEIEKTARAHADQMIAKGLQQIETERAQVAHQVQDKLARAIVLSAEKILRREFSKEDQQQFESELKENLPTLLS
jgi:F-type H+-transporting ATPase subunit b